MTTTQRMHDENVRLNEINSELLAALKEAVRYVELFLPSTTEGFVIRDGVTRTCKAAIAKAEGAAHADNQ